LPQCLSTKHVVHEWHRLGTIEEITLGDCGVSPRHINDIDVALEVLVETALVFLLWDRILPELTGLNVIVELGKDPFTSTDLRDETESESIRLLSFAGNSVQKLHSLVLSHTQEQIVDVSKG